MIRLSSSSLIPSRKRAAFALLALTTAGGPFGAVPTTFASAASSSSSSTSVRPAFLAPSSSAMAAFSSRASLPESATRRPATTLSFDAAAAAPADAAVLVGKKSTLSDLVADETTLGAALLGEGSASSTSSLGAASLSVVRAALDSISGKSGGTAETFVPVSDDKVLRLGIVAVPDEVTRNNHPLSVHSITENLGKVVPEKGDVRVVVAAGGDAGVVTPGAVGLSVARAFPLYSRKTDGGKPKDEVDRTVSVTLLDGSFKAVEDDASTSAMAAAAEGARLAARLVDTPPEELTTEAFSAEAQSVAKSLGSSVTFREIVGDDLEEKGYGGLHGVGRAAVCPPRLVILSYEPSETTDDTETVALVGKGIVYDTGGLSLKPKTGMCGMKADMGGAAGLLGAFYAAVATGTKHRLNLLLCLAENAIGPTAFRNDDILTMYSGKTVEVNNSDAEGRLVLGDGVAHATKHIDGLTLVLDMATLTGAQLVATGKKHAGILTNKAELESRAVNAGLRSGDLCYPLLYAPELLMSEFKSEVADMKNSVKDRGNAQTSCAGHFIEDHLDGEYEGGWIHVDMAGPATNGERGTGYGVGLVLSLLGSDGF
mmetsp:Transcript_3946/g.10889  ORF Transcript_3946/g.10889 Transcript_3946/m.10889 type:complete len:598 (-) Transcript_3946:105-1898(-)